MTGSVNRDPIRQCFFFFFNDTATTEIYTLSLHDALPISPRDQVGDAAERDVRGDVDHAERSEEHTSELQSREKLVCRLLLEKQKNNKHARRESRDRKQRPERWRRNRSK